MDKIDIENESGVVVERNDGVSNNNQYGLSIEDVYQLAKKLLEDNFYKLQEAALDLVKKRVEEFLQSLKEELASQGITNYDSFGQPDVQYALYDSMQSYAKYGKSLEMLTKLMAERLSFDKELKIKVAIDDAIKLVTKLDEESLNYLTCMFLCKQVRFSLGNNVDAVVSRYNHLLSTFPFSNNCTSYLNSLGCLQLHLGNAIDILSKEYKVDNKVLKEKLSTNINLIHSDYGANFQGVVLAITNIKRKAPYINMNFDTWIK